MNRWALGGGLFLSATVFSLSLNPRPSSQSASGEELPQNIEFVYGKLIKDAQVKANGNDLKAAVVDIAGIPANSRYYQEATELQTNWSKDLLSRAQKEYQKANIKEAIELLGSIPPNSPSSQEAEQLLPLWSQQSNQYQMAIALGQKGLWAEALETVNQLKNTDLFSSPAVQNFAQEAILKTFNAGAGSNGILEGTEVVPPQLSAVAPNINLATPEISPEFPGTVVSSDEALVASWQQPNVEPSNSEIMATVPQPISSVDSAPALTPPAKPVEMAASPVNTDEVYEIAEVEPSQINPINETKPPTIESYETTSEPQANLTESTAPQPSSSRIYVSAAEISPNPAAEPVIMSSFQTSSAAHHTEPKIPNNIQFIEPGDLSRATTDRPATSPIVPTSRSYALPLAANPGSERFEFEIPTEATLKGSPPTLTQFSESISSWETGTPRSIDLRDRSNL